MFHPAKVLDAHSSQNQKSLTRSVLYKSSGVAPTATQTNINGSNYTIQTSKLKSLYVENSKTHVNLQV